MNDMMSLTAEYVRSAQQPSYTALNYESPTSLGNQGLDLQTDDNFSAKLQSVILPIILGMLVQAFLLWIFFRWVSMVYLHKRLTDIISGLNRLEPVTGKFTPLKVLFLTIV